MNTRLLTVGMSMIKMSSRVAVAAAALTVLGVAAAPTAQARPVSGDPPFEIVNAHSGLCVGIANGLAGQWPCTDGVDQRWGVRRELGTTGYYQWENVRGECLAIAGGSHATGARIIGTTNCTEDPDQYWQMTSDGQIINYLTADVLAVSAGSTQASAAVIQWPNTRTPDQFWTTPDACAAGPAAALVAPASAQASFALLASDGAPIDSTSTPSEPAAVDLHQIGGGIGGHMWFTHTRPTSDSANEVSGRWKATLSTSTVYQIEVFVPDIGAATGHAATSWSTRASSTVCSAMSAPAPAGGGEGVAGLPCHRAHGFLTGGPARGHGSWLPVRRHTRCRPPRLPMLLPGEFLELLRQLRPNLSPLGFIGCRTAARQWTVWR